MAVVNPTAGAMPGQSPSHSKWVVLKFGGTSVSSVANWKNVAGVLKERLAEGLRPVSRAADPTEFIEVRTFPFDEVVRMVERDEIKDSMTVIAVLHAARRREHRAAHRPER